MNLLRATVELTHRNTRRYGGYLVHMGVVLIFIGFTGHAFNQSEVKEMSQGDTMRIGHYELRMASLEQGENPNYLWYRGIFQVSKNGEPTGHLAARKAPVQGQQRKHFGSRHPPATQRGPVCQFRRHVRR